MNRTIMKCLMSPLLIFLQITYIFATSITPAVLRTPFRCFIWDSTCVTALARNIGPDYIQSIPELSALKLDPVDIDFVRLDQDGLLYDMINSKVYGLNNMIIDELSALTNVRMGRVLFRTDLLFTGTYSANGTMFFQPYYGEGRYWVTLKNLEVELFAPYNIARDAFGEEFIESSEYNFRFDVKDNAEFHFENLYNGDVEQSETMHSLFNTNWKFATSHYGRVFIAKVLDTMAQAYKGYFRLAPLRSLVEY